MDDIQDSAATVARRIAMRALSAPFAMGRRGLARVAGLTFGGRRDTYESLGYERILRPRDYRARYLRGGIAARIVETLPEASWRGGGAVYEDQDPETLTEFEEAFDELNQRLQVWQTFYRADVLAGLGRYSIILLGAPGNLQDPLTSCKPENLKFLTAYSEEDAKIVQFNEDYEDERYAMPVMYSLTRRWEQWPGQMNPPSLPAVSVHYTRVLHIADGLLDDHIFGQPRLQRCWNLLDDLDKIIGGGAEAFWKRADGGTQFKIDPELTFDSDPDVAKVERDAMEKKLNEFTDELRRNIITRGVEINRLGSDVADLKGPAAAVMDQIAATTGIPQRILMGSERGQLASKQDQSNFDDRVMDRRRVFCGPGVARPFIDRMIALGVLPTPSEYEIDWPEKDDLDQKERVAAAVQVALVNTNAKEIVVLPTEIRTIYLGLPAMTAEQQAQADQMKADALQQAQDMMRQKLGAKGGSNNNNDNSSNQPPQRSQLIAAMDLDGLEEALLNDDLPAAETIIRSAIALMQE